MIAIIFEIILCLLHIFVCIIMHYLLWNRSWYSDDLLNISYPTGIFVVTDTSHHRTSYSSPTCRLSPDVSWTDRRYLKINLRCFIKYRQQ